MSSATPSPLRVPTGSTQPPAPAAPLLDDAEHSLPHTQRYTTMKTGENSTNSEKSGDIL